MRILEKAVATSAEHEALAVPPTIGAGVGGSYDKRRTRRSALLRIAALAAVIVVLTIVAFKLGWFDLQHATAMIESLQSGHNLASVAVLFFLLCSVTTAAGFPALPFTVAAGAIFGHLLGSALSWAAALVGTMFGYAIARFVGRETARRWLAKRAVGAALTQSTSFMTLLRLRLVPVIPLSVVNFAAGLARTRFGVYVAATAIGILPTTVVFAYFADSLVRGLQGAKTHAYWDVGIASGVLMLMSLLPLALKKMK
ncbi:MAG TPA: VTT domain-containing protein [Gemmatimonadaceae bacterium]|jgi:uncharacterized membrane protein YdjX (TVP38/TMEM64 family)